MIRRLPALSLMLALAFFTFSAGPRVQSVRALSLLSADASGPTAPGFYIYNLSGGTWSLIMPVNGSGGSPSYAWSPDGSRLAVASADPSTGAGLQVIDLASHNTSLVLSANAGTAGRLAWSPDSSRLAFIFGAAAGSGSNVTSALRVWNAADSSLRTLVPNLASLPTWTPDGSGITVAIAAPTFDLTSNSNRIVTVDATSGNTVQTVVTGPAAACQLGIAWSPDGSYLAYGGHGFHEGCLPGQGGLYTWNAASDDTTQLAGGTAEAPLWLADGTVLDAVASLGDQTGLGSITVAKFQPDGSAIQTLASGLPNDFPPPQPRFQTAGGEIVYAAMNCNGADVWAIDAGSTQPRKLNTGTLYAMYPHLSPDGTIVAWTGAGSSADHLTLTPMSGGPATSVLSGSLGIVPGNFSPDGRWIAFEKIATPFDPCAGP